ncbi:MAG: Crp/Fnr family transcriptional regulator [Cyclobacteriaceae bacterium]|jgi:CRP-like cAMP-binding protein
MDVKLTFADLIQSIVKISSAQVEDFFHKFKLVQLPSNEMWVREGEICNVIGFLESGMIRHFYATEKDEVTRWVSLPGEFVTSLGSFISERPCSHFLQAISPCRIWILSKKDWLILYEQHSVLRDLWVRMIERNVVGFEDRVFQQLASDAEQRYFYFVKHFPGFIEKVPQKYIASMIGVKPESLSRLRAKLGRKTG